METITLTKDSAGLFAELLSQVKISPMEPEADLKWARLFQARQELVAGLTPVANSLSEGPAALIDATIEKIEE